MIPVNWINFSRKLATWMDTRSSESKWK
uniref:Uncharacterized protein n=1 Tax=Tetranychus urticae TaxID=32264 RepID=T1KGB8_TETUR